MNVTMLPCLCGCCNLHSLLVLSGEEAKSLNLQFWNLMMNLEITSQWNARSNSTKPGRADSPVLVSVMWPRLLGPIHSELTWQHEYERGAPTETVKKISRARMAEKGSSKANCPSASWRGHWICFSPKGQLSKSSVTKNSFGNPRSKLTFEPQAHSASHAVQSMTAVDLYVEAYFSYPVFSLPRPCTMTDATGMLKGIRRATPWPFSPLQGASNSAFHSWKWKAVPSSGVSLQTWWDIPTWHNWL